MSITHKRFIRHILYLSLCVVVASCNSNAKDELAHHHHHNGHECERHEGHEECEEHEHEGHNHGEGDEIILHPEQAKRFGVKVAVVRPGTFSSIV